jgi:hypothetical protein
MRKSTIQLKILINLKLAIFYFSITKKIMFRFFKLSSSSSGVNPINEKLEIVPPDFTMLKLK